MTNPQSQPDFQSIRKANLALLNKLGFKVADWLPYGSPEEGSVDGEAQLRPLEEIGKRLWALSAVFTYVSAPRKAYPTSTIRKFVGDNSLLAHATTEERAILSRWRWTAQRRHVGDIGWRTENMLSLAWILGHEQAPTVDGEMLNGDQIRGLICDFIGDLSQPFSSWLARCQPRPELEVIAKEDLFYCAHNAVRNAQLGGDSVPDGFHPIMNGGVVHERRHSLTWAVSPGVDWEQTDLST